MKRIYKYEIIVDDEQTINMPINSIILSCQLQRDNIVLWAMFDDKNEHTTEQRHFKAVPTGALFCIGIYEIKQFLSTVQFSNRLVFHIFEIAYKL